MSGGTESTVERVRFWKSRFDTSDQFEKTCLGSDCTEEQMVVSRGGQCGPAKVWKQRKLRHT